MRHLQSFKYIKAIVEAGSIRGAAESLTISPSALNRHIQNLELDLDMNLFERLKRGVRLSAEGELFYNYALNQLAGFERVKGHIESIKGLNVGRMRLGVSQDIHLGAIMQIVSEFQTENPRVALEVSYVNQANLFDRITGNDLDLALFVNPILRKGMQVHQATDMQLTGFVPVGTGIGSKNVLHLYDLIGTRIALPPHDTEAARRVVAGAEKSNIELSVQYMGPLLSDYLRDCFAPAVGIMAVLDPPNDTIEIPGYTRVSLSQKDLGTCNLCLIRSDQIGLSRAAHNFQEIIAASLD